MEFNNILKSMGRAAYQVLPSLAQSVVAKHYAPALHGDLKHLRGAKADWFDIDNEHRPLLVLPNGVKLIGEVANNKELLIFKHVLKRLQLPKTHVKVAIDYVLRYQHPHMDIACDTINHPAHERRFYHPQHRNLAQECQSLSFDEKIFLSKFFQPRKNWFVVDVGCYLGYGSLWMANIVTEGKVVSVEAIIDNYKVALANRNLNGISNWEIMNAAIWDKPNQEMIMAKTSRQANAMDNTLFENCLQEKVTTTSISAISSKYDSIIDLLSLTVNGAEVEAISGMLKMPKSKLPKRILCPGWYAKDGILRSKIIIPLLHEMGYKVISTTGNFLFAWLPE